MSAKQEEPNIFHTALCDILGIRYPIAQAAMGAFAGPTLAAAVSNAGGLGMLGGIDSTPEEVRDFIRKTKELTDKPFGFDTIFPLQLDNIPDNMTAAELETQLPASAVAFADKFKSDLGLPDVKGRPGVGAISLDIVRKQIDIALEEQVPVLVSALGDPSWVIPDAHAQGVKVMALVGNVKQARHLAEAGVDIIIAQGHEAGGHTGRIGTMALVPQVVDAISPTPVMAAGGIGDGRGLAAALALGAVGVWCGTVFVATHESCIDAVQREMFTQWEMDIWKQAVLAATEEDTCVTRIYSGKTLRAIKNKFIERWDKTGGPYLPFPLQPVLIGDVQEGIRVANLKDYYTWSAAGQVAGMLTEIQSSQQVIDRMVEEASKILTSGLARMTEANQ